MSSDFYFKKWQRVLNSLEILIKTDVENQTEKVHDQHLSGAVHRVAAILGQYMTLYNEAIECLKHNLQVQKTEHIRNIVMAIVYRILELKQNLEKLEGSNIHFFGLSVAANHHTPDDVEMTTVVPTKRPQDVQDAIDTAFQRAKEKREALENTEDSIEEEEDKEEINRMNLRIFLEEVNEESNSINKEDEIEIPEEERVKLGFLNLIKAHERLRQVTRHIKLDKLKREDWKMHLAGTARPPARYELRQKAAQLIQNLARSYIKLKRKRLLEAKRDQILGLTMCRPSPNLEGHLKIDKNHRYHSSLYDDYEKGCILQIEETKREFIKRRGHEVEGDYRDLIRYWFYKWFESIRFIHEIPKEGLTAILMEDVPDPYEWHETYKEKLKDQKANKRKSAEQLKYEQKEAKRLAQMEKREMLLQQKAEAALLKKMMKNPKMHPGYNYPQSAKIKKVIEAIDGYYEIWKDYDIEETLDVKCKYVENKNIEDAYKDAKIEILNDIHQDMEAEYQELKTALRNDYKNNNEEMPEEISERKPVKKPKKIKPISIEKLTTKLEALALQGFIVEYPETKLDDYVGDPNFAGEDLRRLIRPAYSQSFELRALWWDKCDAVSNKSLRILLVGPEQSGKVTLVHAMASMNGAVLFIVDPISLPVAFRSKPQLKSLSNNFLFCARAVQPSVIYIRHVQKLYYRKEPPEEAELQLSLLQRFFVQNLLKKINKHEKITIVGTCSDPWLTRSKLLKHFPTVVLLPNVTYSLTVQQLKDWMAKYPSIPSDFDVSNLAHVLRGYTYGYLKETLNKFMSPERLVSIAAKRLTAMDVHNYILDNEPDMTVEYDRYLQWYHEKTPAGMKEKQHYNDQVEFKQAVEKYEAKLALKEKLAMRSAPPSAKSSRSGF